MLEFSDGEIGPLLIVLISILDTDINVFFFSIFNFIVGLLERQNHCLPDGFLLFILRFVIVFVKNVFFRFFLLFLNLFLGVSRKLFFKLELFIEV